jgi:hypothetical protein
MAMRQQSQSNLTKEAAGTRGRANTNKTSSKSSNNRRSKARAADDRDTQMQAAMPSDAAGQRNGRSKSGNKDRSGLRSKKNASTGKSTAPKRTRAAR